MKNKLLCTWTAVGVSVLMVTTVSWVAADESSAPAPVKSASQLKIENYTGTVQTVKPNDHQITVRNGLRTRTFNLGDSCTYRFSDKSTGSLDNLRPGQKVTVVYRNAQGVLVASDVFQQPMRYEGDIKSIDLDRHVLVLNTGVIDRDLRIEDGCTVALRDNKSGALTDLKPGHHVTVTYETPAGKMVVRDIAQTSDTFVGSLTAIDLTDRTVKAKNLLGQKKFNVSKQCTVVVNGQTSQLGDLKPGDKLVVSYEPVDGVNVVNRIGVGETQPPESATAQTQTYAVP